MDGTVVRVERCSLRVVPGDWEFTGRHRAEIDAHWARRSAGDASIFNGTIHVMASHSLGAGVFTARFLKTDFKSYLYWRDTGMADSSVADAFGSALIRSAEGHVLLGQQREGVNAGLAYLPGGFIDERDVAPDGTIDIEASIGRELSEETGLAPVALDRVAGFILTFAGPLVSVAVEFRSKLSAANLRARILEHIGAEQAPELSGVIVVTSLRDIEGLPMPHYASVLVAELYKGR
jgi:ADP-ribose pyrophosphatase YjhB (NUDIX family)